MTHGVSHNRIAPQILDAAEAVLYTDLVPLHTLNAWDPMTNKIVPIREVLKHAVEQDGLPQLGATALNGAGDTES